VDNANPQVIHNLALVLGGGGAAGNAWLIGVIAGLAEAGLDLTEVAELVIGTSAVATAATQVRRGKPPAGLLAGVLSSPARPFGQNRDQAGARPMAVVFERMRGIGAAAATVSDLRRGMGAFGLESDAVLGVGAAWRRAVVAARLPRREWPDRLMIVTAVDAKSGELVEFDREWGVELVDAIAASTAGLVLCPRSASMAVPHRRWHRRWRKCRLGLGLCERRGACAVRRKGNSRACLDHLNGAQT
jgi:NTE family protein